jgi:hypothetical protein
MLEMCLNGQHTRKHIRTLRSSRQLSKEKETFCTNLRNTWDRCNDFFKKYAGFFTQNKAKLCKKLIITLVFEKNSNFFAENCQKSQKIVTITSTPGYVERVCNYFDSDIQLE